MDQSELNVEIISSSIQLNIRDLTAVITVTQSFKNALTEAIEIQYTFPLKNSAAVSSFEATVDNKKIKSVLREKTKAKKEYDDALAQGHGAILGEQGGCQTDRCHSDIDDSG